MHARYLRFTASGCESPGSLRVFLDDVELLWTTHGTLDRSFYTYEDMAAGFSSGTHKLRFEQGTSPPDRNPIRQLCSLTMHESVITLIPTRFLATLYIFKPKEHFFLLLLLLSSSSFFFFFFFFFGWGVGYF